MPYFLQFKSKEFLFYQAGVLRPHVTCNSYKEIECSFVNSCTNIHNSAVPADANIISTHVLYKLKALDDGTKLCKSRIAPHVSNGRDHGDLKTDSASCPPLCFRVLLSICALLQFYVGKVDIKMHFFSQAKLRVMCS